MYTNLIFCLNSLYTLVLFLLYSLKVLYKSGLIVFFYKLRNPHVS